MYENLDENSRDTCKVFILFYNFADLCLKNYPFFLISRQTLQNYPLLPESGYERGLRFDREWRGRDPYCAENTWAQLLSEMIVIF